MALRTWCLSCGEPTRAGSYCRVCRPRNGSTRSWRQTRERVLARDGWLCRYCGEQATQVDHIVPLARGGFDHEANLAASCASCNLAKGSQTPSAR